MTHPNAREDALSALMGVCRAWADNGFPQALLIAKDIRAALSAPPSQRESDDAWVLLYEDQDRKPEIFSGFGANDAARRRYEQLRTNWNCHLFRRVSSDLDTNTILGSPALFESESESDDEGLVEAIAALIRSGIGDGARSDEIAEEVLSVAREAITPSQSGDFQAGYERGVQDAADVAVPYGRGDYVGFISEKILKLLDAKPALTPSPADYVRPEPKDYPDADSFAEAILAWGKRTAYVRPAADIRAEIERVETELRAIRHTERAKIEAKAHIAALTWALTPPTEEPK